MKTVHKNFWSEQHREKSKDRLIRNSDTFHLERNRKRHKKSWGIVDNTEDVNLNFDINEILEGKENVTDNEEESKSGRNNKSVKVTGQQEMMSLYQCAEELKQRVYIVCVQNALYIYNGRNYERIDANQLLKLYRDKVDKTLHCVKNMSALGSLYKFLLTDSTIETTVDYSALNNMAPLKNGVFDVKKQRLKPHSAEYLFMYCIDADYTFDDETPIFDAFLHTVTDGDKTLMIRLWYLIAYLCMHSVEAKAFFVLGTAPNSGKSVFGKFIESLFAPQFVSSVSLNDMNKDFSLGQIVGKAVNISMDLPSSKLNSAAVSKLKMLTGDDLITINEKYVPQFRYYNRAKFVFASNHPVCIADNDEAFWNRLVYFPFNRSIPAEEQDKALLNKLLQEKDAIVSKALRYGKKFINDNYVFPTTQEIEDTIAVWKGEKNYSVENFLRDCCEFDSSYSGEWGTDLYSAYTKYCAFRKMVSVSSETFKNILKTNSLITAGKFRKNSNENPRHGFRGIRLKT